MTEIYILRNEHFPTWIRVGYSTDFQKDLQSFNSGVIVPYDVYARYGVESEEKAKEFLDVFNQLGIDSRDNTFFKVTLREGLALLREWAQKKGLSNGFTYISDAPDE